MGSELPIGIRVLTDPAVHQAVCTHCGWHTRPDKAEMKVLHLAKAHAEVCPRPFRRNGALMSCGCWWYAQAGSAAGHTKARCPLHGEATMVKANVRGRPWGTGTWEADRG